MPHPPNSSISISKWMYEFKLVMKHSAFDQRVQIGFLVPRDEIVNLTGNKSCGRCHMYDFLSIEHTNALGSEFSIVWD